MINHWYYNLINGFKMKGYKKMTLDSIMSHVRECNKIKLLDEKHPSIEVINNDIFYIHPNFNEINSDLGSKFVIFSAAGATGKSALAKYLAKSKNGLYWDLSKIVLGENSFHGTLTRALGYDRVNNFFTDLNNSKALLVIDAFDEAEIISGRASVEYLLNDLDNITKNSTTPTIVLLARTETSVFISNYCNSKNIQFCYYEIGFFEEYNAKTFIKDKIKLSGRIITPVIDKCIEQQFNEIKRLLTDNELIASFIGYAPVLEALTKAYDEEKNTAKLLSTLHEGSSSSSIISQILKELIEREHLKVCNALRERWQKKHPEFSEWENVYTFNEQMILIISYIIFENLDTSIISNKFIPSYLLDEYNQVLLTFLPQHPFIQNFLKDNLTKYDFTGPAFRDYVLAYIISSTDNEYFVYDYLSINFSKSHSTSQLFIDFFMEFNSNLDNSKHFSILYDSFKSKETLGTFSAV